MGYVGTIYIGSNRTPAKVLFDTGSDYLAVTSSLCNEKSWSEKGEEMGTEFDPSTYTFRVKKTPAEA